jgi:Zn-dependent M32 family carboxypeptidase
MTQKYSSEIEKNLNIVKKIDQELGMYRGISMLLSWDECTYLPKNGQELRGKQKTFLALKTFDLINSKELIDAVNYLKIESNYTCLDTLEKRRIDLFKDEIDYCVNIPKEHVEKSTMLESKLYNLWILAKEKESFEMIVPDLKEMFSLRKKKLIMSIQKNILMM